MRSNHKENNLWISLEPAKESKRKGLLMFVTAALTKDPFFIQISFPKMEKASIYTELIKSLLDTEEIIAQMIFRCLGTREQ